MAGRNLNLNLKSPRRNLVERSLAFSVRVRNGQWLRIHVCKQRSNVKMNKEVAEKSVALRTKWARCLPTWLKLLSQSPWTTAKNARNLFVAKTPLKSWTHPPSPRSTTSTRAQASETALDKTPNARAPQPHNLIYNHDELKRTAHSKYWPKIRKPRT